MAFSDFPFAEFLTHGDFLVYVKPIDHDEILAPASDLLTWYPHNCSCNSCEIAEQIKDKFLLHKANRVNVEDSPFNIVYFDVAPDESTMFTSLLLLATDTIKPITHFNQE